MARKKIQKRRALVPTDIVDVARLLARIAEEQRKIDDATADMNQKIDELKLKTDNKMQLHADSIKDMLGGIFLFGEAHRDALTDNGKVKTIKTPTGSFGWRINPPSVDIRGKVKTLIATLQKAGLDRFVRTKPELNKEAMLQEPDVAETIKGIKIRRNQEDFFVKLDQETLEVDEVILSVENLRKTYA